MELGSPAVMPVRAQLPVQELARVHKNAGVRIGVYTGIALAMGFTAWLYVANRRRLGAGSSRRHSRPSFFTVAW